MTEKYSYYFYYKEEKKIVPEKKKENILGTLLIHVGCLPRPIFFLFIFI